MKNNKSHLECHNPKCEKNHANCQQCQKLTQLLEKVTILEERCRQLASTEAYFHRYCE